MIALALVLAGRSGGGAGPVPYGQPGAYLLEPSDGCWHLPQDFR